MESAHCKGALKRGLPTKSGNQGVTIIPERDLCSLIMRSRLPAASGTRLAAMVGDKVMITSLKVAETFDKQHGHIIRDVKALDCSE